jgi:hypothetical protein
MHFKDHQNNRMDEKSDVHLYINHFFIALMFKNSGLTEPEETTRK